jgi:hypothetical protein
MSYCQQCGEELDQEQEFCSECGADLTAEDDSKDESFINRYGAKPLPLASARGEFIRIYGSLLNAIPVFGSFMKLFVGLGWWFHSINLKILRLITMDADINDRFDADFIYLKDSFSSGYNDETAPPNPPE